MLYLVLAYLIIWAAAFVLILSMVRRQADLRREIATLKELARDKETGR